MVSWDRRK